MSKKSKPNMCFEGMTFCLTGAMSMGTRKKVFMIIQSHGGNASNTVTGGVTHLVASEAEYMGETNKVVTAKAKGTMIVTEEFLSACMDAGEKVDEKPYLLSKGSDGGASLKNKKQHKVKIEKEYDGEDGEMSDEEGGFSTKKQHDGKLQYIKKGKSAVDPFCKFLVKDAHVLEEGDDVYSTMLNLTDISFGVKGSNKFYVLQLIEHDKKNKYWVWSRWGRVGVVGQRRAQEYNDKNAAKAEFFKRFKSKTGNDWEERDTAKNKSGKYNVVEIDYGSEDDDEKETHGSDEDKEYKHKKPKKYQPSPYNTDEDDMSTEEDVPDYKKNKAKGKEQAKEKQEKVDSDDEPPKKKINNNNNNNNKSDDSNDENEASASSSSKASKTINNNNNKNKNNNNKDPSEGSNLHPRLQEFIKLICDVKMMKQELLNMDIDLKRMPLGN